ncbi:hypothetical protein C4K06_6155 [Pseudomonas chlororaphis subsp. aureofaciens]|uniref:hypothetical protein n=1 Tax=Pseudomonas chlororaphis TaxID=587753 RepID=UPI000F564222|nr:hypothetical protein [Pseudomonas chlororaphis]AZE39143.1 hypothetical protein C4K06_6155 [Pseudomonas chlororaphis subsp. aureofaciens]
MPSRTLPSHLSLSELISARNTGTDVQGVGVEADADRLLISSQFSEAAEAYRALDLDNVNRREKLAYCLYCAGQRDFHTVLEDDVELATPWGLALHLWAFDRGRFPYNTSKEELSERLAKILQRAVEMDSWPKLREGLIAGCWYQSLQQRYDTPAMIAIRSSASTVLGKMGSALQETLELCTGIFNYYQDRSEPQVRALRDMVSAISAKKTPVLSALFSAALTVRDTQQAKSALAELCRRYRDDQDLESTVSAVVVESGCPEWLDCLPEELRAVSQARPEIRLAVAIERQDQREVHALAESMPANGPSDSVLNLPRIAEPFFNFLLSGRTSHIGGWGSSAPWEAVLGERLTKVLPRGALRNSFLQNCRDFLSEEELAARSQDLCDLFETSLADDDFYWIERAECLHLVSIHSFAKYLVKRAFEESDYPPFDREECVIPWDRFVPPIKEELLSLQPKVKATIESVFEDWGIPLRPTLELRLAGEGLPVAVSGPLSDVEAAISELSGGDLAYLQLALLKISAKVAERISPAAAHEVAVRAYNDFLRPGSLTELGEERVRALANRYGAARFLQGLDALMRSPEFNPETDRDLPALSKMLVKLQGSLPGRRAYLAGVLRKRLKKLKSHWLDQQVSEAMNRGVDIEQMIDLAKGVTTWDDWTDGLARLVPY